MKNLYDDISFKSSKYITKTYSTSFSLGINLLDKSLHEAIYSIYGFVRLADEIVDTFHEYPKKSMLEDLKSETYLALERGISINPVLNSFQLTVSKFNDDRELIDLFLKSMEQDLYDVVYSDDSYHDYIVGSAEVVGLMCLKVFVNGQQDLYDKLESPARSLGAAFQKVNFLRDVKSDYENLGRTYFPDVDLSNFSIDEKIKIEQDIHQDFTAALIGIKKLPKSSKLGVYVAYRYYLSLFNKIKSIPPNAIMNTRVRIPNSKKIFLTFRSAVKNQLNLI